MPRRLTSIGHELDLSATTFGDLRESNDILDNPPRLMRRMEEDGYLLLRGFLGSQELESARAQVLDWLSAQGQLHPGRPVSDAVASPEADTAFTPEDHRFPEVRRLTHGHRLQRFYSDLLGGEARIFDYIWMRLMSPGAVTGPHYDIVYMGRGTSRVYTSWIPLGDVSFDHGPLMILENSHRFEKLKQSYGRMDIDTDRNWTRVRFRHGKFFRGGDYSRNPRAVQRQFKTRWLSSEFRAGDIVLFTGHTMHGSIDNRSSQVRISVDTRFQLNSEPMDERWIGENPIAHSGAT